MYVPPDSAKAVVFAGDGGWHISRLGAALDAATTRSTMVVGVHGLPDDDGRLTEYVPGFDASRFAAHERFFVDDVRRWVRTRLGVALPAEQTAVWGASLRGELALAMGLRHPDTYGAVFSASPGAGCKPPAVMPSSLPSVYLEAGSQEQFFLENATRWADALRSAGADAFMTERVGPHGGEFWERGVPADGWLGVRTDLTPWRWHFFAWSALDLYLTTGVTVVGWPPRWTEHYGARSVLPSVGRLARISV